MQTIIELINEGFDEIKKKFDEPDFKGMNCQFVKLNACAKVNTAISKKLYLYKLTGTGNEITITDDNLYINITYDVTYEWLNRQYQCTGFRDVKIVEAGFKWPTGLEELENRVITGCTLDKALWENFSILRKGYRKSIKIEKKYRIMSKLRILDNVKNITEAITKGECTKNIEPEDLVEELNQYNILIKLNKLA